MKPSVRCSGNRGLWRRSLDLLLLSLSAFVIFAHTGPIVISQSPFWEDDDWTFAIGEDHVVTVDVVMTIHPGDRGPIKSRNMTFPWFASDFQASEYQTDLQLRTITTENKTSGFFIVSVFLPRPRSDDYKFALRFTLTGRVGKEPQNDTYRFMWMYPGGPIHSQHVVVKLPAHYTLVTMRSNPPEAFDNSIEDDRQVVRFTGPTDAVGFAWSVTYARIPPTMIETITDVIQDNLRLVSLGGSAIGAAATALGFLFKTRKRRLVKHYLNAIDSTFNEFYADKERCRLELTVFRDRADSLFTKDRIDEFQHGILVKKAEWYLDKL